MEKCDAIACCDWPPTEQDTGRTSRALDAAVEYLKRHHNTDGICYVVSCAAEVLGVEILTSMKHGLVHEVFGFAAQGTLHVCGSPLYLRHVGNMDFDIKGEPLYVMDHSVRELLAETYR